MSELIKSQIDLTTFDITFRVRNVKFVNVSEEINFSGADPEFNPI